MRHTLTFLLTALLLSLSTQAMAEEDIHRSLNLPIQNYGLSFGNSENFNGLRISFEDRFVKRVSGIHLALAQPTPSHLLGYDYVQKRTDMTQRVDGFNICPISYATEMNGIQLGLFNNFGQPGPLVTCLSSTSALVLCKVPTQPESPPGVAL